MSQFLRPNEEFNLINTSHARQQPTYQKYSELYVSRSPEPAEKSVELQREFSLSENTSTQKSFQKRGLDDRF